MKKILLALAFFLCLMKILNALDKKTNVFHGYEKVKAYSTLQTVKKYYKNLIKIDRDSDVYACYEQKHPEIYIEYRRFYFYYGKLYNVNVFYNDEFTKDEYLSLWGNIWIPLGKTHVYRESKEKWGRFIHEIIHEAWVFNSLRMEVNFKQNNRYTTNGVRVRSSAQLDYEFRKY